jgi:hypothetical protein
MIPTVTAGSSACLAEGKDVRSVGFEQPPFSVDGLDVVSP